MAKRTSVSSLLPTCGGTVLALAGTLEVIREIIPSPHSLLYSLHLDDVAWIKKHLGIALGYICEIEQAALEQAAEVPAVEKEG